MTTWNEDVGSCQGGMGRYGVSARNNSIGLEKKQTRGRTSLTLADFPCLKKSRSIVKKAMAPIELFADEQQESRDDTLRMVVDKCNRIWHTDIISSKSTISLELP